MLSDIITIVPLTIVMVVGPQIITSIILTTRQNRVGLTMHYLLGATVGIISVVGLSYVTGFGLSGPLNLPEIVDWIIVALLTLVIIMSYLNRNKVEPKKEEDTGKSSKMVFISGMLLLGIFPSDLITNVAVGYNVSTQDNPLIYFVIFLGITLFWLAMPLLIAESLGSKADGVLIKIRHIIDSYSWVIASVICLFLIVHIVIDNIL